MNTPPDRLPLADRFDAHQRTLNTFGYQLFSLLGRALQAMYPIAAYVMVSTDSVDKGRYLQLALAADGAVVYDFSEHDGGQLPELPAEFGRHYDPRDLREVQLLLSGACGIGAQLPYVPEHMDPHADGRCLLLDFA